MYGQNLHELLFLPALGSAVVCAFIKVDVEAVIVFVTCFGEESGVESINFVVVLNFFAVVGSISIVGMIHHVVASIFLLLLLLTEIWNI